MPRSPPSSQLDRSQGESGEEDRATTARVPCQACRRRKIKCNRKRPCDFCSNASLHCQYSGAVSKPGLRAGYVRSLESRVKTLEEEFQSFKRTIHRDSTSNSNASNIAPTPDVIRLQQTTLSHTDGEEWFRNRDLFMNISSIWFNGFHEWLPILHRPSIIALAEQSFAYNHPEEVPIVLRSLLVSLAKKTRLGEYGLDRIFYERLQKDILAQCLSEVSCEALQALIILAVFALGDGDMPKYWNFITLCRRVSMQLGLHDLVVHFCTNFERTSLLPPRMLPIPDSDVEIEQRVRAYWIVNTLDSAVSIGVSWNLFVPTSQLCGLTVCSDEEWDKPKGQICLFADPPSEPLSPFALLIKFVNNELWPIHKFHQNLCELTVSTMYERRKSASQSIDNQLAKAFATYTRSADNASSDSNRVVTYNSNYVLMCCMANVAVITLFQRMILPPLADSNLPSIPWSYAVERCVGVCDHLTSVLQELSEKLHEVFSPLLSALVFIAARFYLIIARIQGREPPSNASFLIYVLRRQGTHWTLAARLGDVLGAATGLQSASTNGKPHLPPQFWDLAYSWQDIDSALAQWSLLQN